MGMLHTERGTHSWLGTKRLCSKAEPPIQTAWLIDYNGYFAVLLGFLKINGYVQSMREENSQEKTITYSKRIPQVIILKVFSHHIILLSSNIFRIQDCSLQMSFYWFDVFNLDLFESTLWKKGKDNKQFLKRIFSLSKKDFTLRYFIKEDVSSFFAVWLFLMHIFLWAYLGYSQIVILHSIF